MMQVAVILGVFEGVEFDQLDDPVLMRTLLQEAVAAADFSLINIHVHHFEPQGVTGLALVGESHVAVHTWPEEGVLFVDVASCTTLEAGRACLEAFAARLPGARLTVRESQYVGPRPDGTPGLDHLPPVGRS